MSTLKYFLYSISYSKLLTQIYLNMHSVPVHLFGKQSDLKEYNTGNRIKKKNINPVMHNVA